MKILGIIPARFGSTRFPGKPLALIQGKPMIMCVYEQARKCKLLTDVIIATDDKRIKAAVKKFKGKVVMTSSKHVSGTDRCQEAVKKLKTKFDAVINIQGDEPFIRPEQIGKVARCFQDPSVEIATLVKKIASLHELTSHHTVKAVLGRDNQALYFSRTAIPYYRGENFSEWIKLHTYYKHIGIYGYRTGILQEITRLEPSSLEVAEALEQLRWLENGYKITVQKTDFDSTAIDTPEDLNQVLKDSSRRGS